MSCSVVILTNPGDPHSFAVRHILRKKGVEPVVWHTTDFPTLQSGSLHIEKEYVSWEIDGSEIHLANTPVSSVWVRRPEPPVLPETLDPQDFRFAAGECSVFLRSLQRLIGADAFWVNPLESYGRASLKSEQLMAASRLGFKIPATLFSNQPQRIRDFLLRNKQGIIYKSFLPASWSSEAGVSVLFTTRLQEEELDDPSLQVCPGIFQEYIEKSCEFRVTIIGSQIFAVKILSQSVESGTVDWRAALGRVPLEPWTLPADVEVKCFRLMAELGLAFGCFDLILTPGGDYVFLEVNEMGAFLWIEQSLPEVPLLDSFCELLIQGRSDFKPTSRKERLCWSDDLAAAVRHQMEVEAPGRHVLSARSAG